MKFLDLSCLGASTTNRRFSHSHNSLDLGFLKKLDVNDSKVNLYSTSRNKLTNEKKFEENHGSIFGGIFSIIS